MSHGERLFPSPKEFSEKARIKDLAQYRALYARSIKDPEGFWSEAASRLSWTRRWDKVMRWDFKTAEVAFYEGGRLLPCGTVGGGFEPSVRTDVGRKLAELRVDESPLTPRPVMVSPVRWVRPELVVAVRYSEWSPDGTLRFPIFDALRPEVHPVGCTRQRPRVVLTGRTPPDSPSFYLTRFPF